MAFAGVSLIADGKLCASTKSVINSGGDSGYHLLVIEGYSRTKEKTPNGECIKSRPFIVGGRRWTINYLPNGDLPDNEEFISLGLILEDDIKQSIEVRYVFSFIDQPELRVPKHIRQSQPVYLDFDEYFDYQPEFVKREVFERSRHLKDDSFVLRCDLVVLKSTTLLPFTELPQSDLQSHLSDLLLSKEGADITFEVDGKEFAAHRYMLAVRSAVFKAQLFGSMNVGAATSSVAKIENIKANVFQGLLTFIYTDGMPKFEIDSDNETEDKEEDDDTEEDDTEEDWLLQLLEAAERYGIQRLKSICEEKLTELICKDTVADIIVVAERNGCLWLKQSCLEFVKTSTNLLTVFTADGLEQIIRTCSPSVLKDLLSKFAS